MLIPRDYQEEADRALWNYFRTHATGNPVVAMPTGTGKAFQIALFLHRAFAAYQRQKVLVVTHVKELIGQNYLEFIELWPNAPAGVYSAGLKRKDTSQAIIFCGIASIIKNMAAFGKVDLVIVDECHLISQDDESMYLKVFAVLQKLNPALRIIGFTATPWRAGQGKITDNGIFTDICFDVTDMKSFNRFIKEGYLAPLVPKRTKTEMDITGVHVRGGEFVEKELQLAAANDEVTFAAIQEAVVEGRDRKCWLVFGTGIAHVEKIVKMLNYLGVSARCVHSKMLEKERDQNIEDWKNGKFTAMVNNGVLTTGLNHKPIDMIIMLRATHSTVLWVQMLGRGTRPYDWLTEVKEYLKLVFQYTKNNCLVLDFAGNTRRLGPINDPVIPRKRGEKTGEVPIKLCEGCGTYNHISARFCGGKSKDDPEYNVFEGCGAPFIFQTLIKNQASTDELIKDDFEMPDVRSIKVDQITFQIHRKVGKPDGIRLTYWCGLMKYPEFVLPEHEGFGRRKAVSWWRARTSEPLPATTAETFEKIATLPEAQYISVHVNKKPYPEILSHTFADEYDENAIPFDENDIPI